MPPYLSEQCTACGRPHWWRYWVGEYCDSSRDGLSVTDTDLIFHRFKNVRDGPGSRLVEHIMLVEVKTGGEQLRLAQRDTLAVFNGAISAIQPIDGSPIGVQSRAGFFRKGYKAIKWHGVHLWQVPPHRSDTGPFYWDYRPIEADVLKRVLSFELDPNCTSRRLDVDRRHKRRVKKSEPLFSEGD